MPKTKERKKLTPADTIPTLKDPTVKKIIKFNKDGSVEATIGGETSTISKEEWEARFTGSKKGGPATEAGNNLKANEARARQDADILAREKARLEELSLTGGLVPPVSEDVRSLAENLPQALPELPGQTTDKNKLNTLAAQAGMQAVRPNNPINFLASLPLKALEAVSPGITEKVVSAGAAGLTEGGIGTAGGFALSGGNPLAAGAGGLALGLRGGYQEITSSAKEDVGEGWDIYKQSKKNMASILSDSNAKRIPPAVAAARWQDNLNNIAIAKRQIKFNSLAQTNWMGEGKRKLTSIETWEEEIPQLSAELANSFVNPDPNKNFDFLLSDTGTEE